MEEGSVGDSDDSDADEPNLAHAAEVILENGFHQHAQETAQLSQPEESAVGIPAEALESTAMHIPAETHASVKSPHYVLLLTMYMSSYQMAKFWPR